MSAHVYILIHDFSSVDRAHARGPVLAVREVDKRLSKPQLSLPYSSNPQPAQPPSPSFLRNTYIEKDTELLRIGRTRGLRADHGHGAAGLAQAEARGSGHTGSRESGRRTQKAHRGLEQQSRSHGH